MMNQAMNHRHIQGLSLIEVMVALMILSIGLLGIAGLQVVSMRSNHGSYVRGQAIVLTYDMADRMRANSLGVRDINLNAVNFYNSSDTGGQFQAAANNSCSESFGTAATTCSVAQVAANDRFEWQAVLAARLPQGQGTVCLDSTPNDGTGVAGAGCDNTGNVYAIKVWWQEVEPDTGPVNKRFVMRFQL